MPFWRKRQRAEERAHGDELARWHDGARRPCRTVSLANRSIAVDGRLKVTGGAKYAYEFAQGPEALYGYLVQATIAKGRVTAIDRGAAESSPGVMLVMTHENAPSQGGPSGEAHPVLSSPEVAYYGQPVALVVAQSFEEARAGAYLIRVTYEEAAGHYQLQPHLAEARVTHGGGQPPESSVGDFAGAFTKAPTRLDVTYTTPLESHAMMEPHATLAVWNGDSVTLHTSNQMPDRGRAAVAKTLKMSQDKVRLISPFIGGGFGSKLAINADAILAAMAARALNHPVKVALTRQQIFNVTTHRSDTIQRVRLGTDESGRILAIGHDAYSGNLRTKQQFEAAADQTRTLYAGANRLTRNRLVPLDAPVASAMRAPGEAVGLLALECAMDELAHGLGIDPIELRIRNEPSEDPEKHIPYSSRHLVECYHAGAARFGWSRRSPKPGQVRQGQWLIGMGMAAATRGNTLLPSSASVHLGPDGIATVKMAMTDIGTGSYTILTQIAAEMLGLSPGQVRMELGDTDYPQAAGSGGSFGAASSGSALYVACDRMRAQLAGRGRHGCRQGRVSRRHDRLGWQGGCPRKPGRCCWHRGVRADPPRRYGEKIFPAVLRRSVRRGGCRRRYRRDSVAADARCLYRRAYPEREDGAVAGDRRDDLRRRRRAGGGAGARPPLRRLLRQPRPGGVSRPRACRPALCRRDVSAGA